VKWNPLLNSDDTGWNQAGEKKGTKGWNDDEGSFCLLDLAAWSPSMSLTDSGLAVATAVQKRHSARDSVPTAGTAGRSSEILQLGRSGLDERAR
jgi:hypothetical protein